MGDVHSFFFAIRRNITQNKTHPTPQTHPQGGLPKKDKAVNHDTNAHPRPVQMHKRQTNKTAKKKARLSVSVLLPNCCEAVNKKRIAYHDEPKPLVLSHLIKTTLHPARMSEHLMRYGAIKGKLVS